MSRRYSDGDVLLYGPSGEPYMTWRVAQGYRRQTIGFEAPTARGTYADELFGRGRVQRPPVIDQAKVEDQEEGREGEGCPASEDQQ